MSFNRSVSSLKFKSAVAVFAFLTLVFGSTWFLSKAARPQQNRSITVKTFKYLPLTVSEVRHLHDEGDNWFRDLEIDVTNTSEKPIYFFGIHLRFPNVQISGGAAFGLLYGRAELSTLDGVPTPEDKPIKPGETYTFRIPEARVKGWAKMRKRLQLPADGIDVIELSFGTINFGDRTGFTGTKWTDYRGKPPRTQTSYSHRIGTAG